MDGVMTMRIDDGQDDGVVNYCRQLRNEDPFYFIPNTCKEIHEVDCIYAWNYEKLEALHWRR